MCVNGKNETCWKLFQEWGELGVKENDGEGEFNYNIL
jgi:hypothetical protein